MLTKKCISVPTIVFIDATGTPQKDEETTEGSAIDIKDLEIRIAPPPPQVCMT